MTVKIMVGHVLHKLAELPDESVHCVVSSPPYWGLRDYGLEPQVWGGSPGCAHEWGDTLRCPGPSRFQGNTGERANRGGATIRETPRDAGAYCARCGAWRGSLGLEPDYRLFLTNIVAVFRAVRRVLRRDGTLWLNIGDSYASTVNGRSAAETKAIGKDDRTFRDKPFSTVQGPLKPKDLCGIPWRVALALQDDGWWLRKDNIWHKPSPMPESARDRCTTAHEYLFHFAKSADYFYDAEAIKEPAGDDVGRGVGGWATEGDHQAITHQREDAPESHSAKHPRPSAAKGSFGGKTADTDRPAFRAVTRTRNKRSVWTIASQPFPEAHFATFPPALIEPVIKAATSVRGVCASCGAPWRRIVERQFEPQGDVSAEHAVRHEGQHDADSNWPGTARGTTTVTPVAWEPSCSCELRRTVAATVLDPFFGAGTTGLVADRLGRDCIGIELNPGYAEMARRRIERDAGLFAEVA